MLAWNNRKNLSTPIGAGLVLMMGYSVTVKSLAVGALSPALTVHVHTKLTRFAATNSCIIARTKH